MAVETRYARTTDGTHVAYQVHGDGPLDILVMRSWHSNLDNEWTDPVLAGIYLRLGAMGRVIRLDRRGTGLSDRIDLQTLPTLEDRAAAIRASLRELGLEVKIGLHAGECERVGTGLRGIAVHIGARIAAAAESGEILVSRTVRDLVAGSGIGFEDAGRHDLKGVPERWQVYRVTRSDNSDRGAGSSL